VVFTFAQYLIELTLVEARNYKFKPSLIAAAGIYTAKKALKRNNAWCSEMGELAGYTEREVRECAKDLCCLLNMADTRADCQGVYRKFSRSEFFEVAAIPLAAKKLGANSNNSAKRNGNSSSDSDGGNRLPNV
jgi:hypothetical protein